MSQYHVPEYLLEAQTYRACDHRDCPDFRCLTPEPLDKIIERLSKRQSVASLSLESS